ncbi:whey acidic protein-like [Gigantopelta aegis]|uniref:whey acidic protein-like n=1 Tax=Gigantopelta aegis TaxID=1735272 RepID=UPI001B88B5B7|nr:whey acidic protein-like [Gigantopelta aegis]
MGIQLLVIVTICVVTQITNFFCLADPCATVRCGPGKVCRLQQVYCIRAPCPPIPVCRASIVDITKCGPGAGPVLGMDQNEIFCGRGPNRRSCPDHTVCKIHPTDRFAVCCWKGPINQQKPGFCPFPRPGMGICIAKCSSDFDCPGRMKCCGNCPRECRRPVPIAKPKPGRCPSFFLPRNCRNKYKCRIDSDCKRNMKCCGSRCGRICKRPSWGVSMVAFYVRQ